MKENLEMDILVKFGWLNGKVLMLLSRNFFPINWIIKTIKIMIILFKK